MDQDSDGLGVSRMCRRFDGVGAGYAAVRECGDGQQRKDVELLVLAAESCSGIQ
jgi:hypothetical protein